MRQVSPESTIIYDFIMALYSICSGNWSHLASTCDVSDSDMNAFLDYASTFLSNIGNYYVRAVKSLCMHAARRNLTTSRDPVIKSLYLV